MTPSDVPLVFKQFGIMEFHEPGIYEAHIHDYMEVFIPLRGLYKCNLNSSSLCLGPGALLLVQYGDHHCDFFQQGSSFATFRIEVSDARFQRPFRRLANEESRMLSLSASPLLGTLADALRNEADRTYAAYGVMDGLCRAFFWKLMELYPRELLSAEFLKAVTQKSYRDKLLAIFNEHVYSELDIDAVAAKFSVSRRTLYEICQEAFGTSIANAFMAYKMRRSANVLALSDVKIHELASRFGFKDPFHFSRAFKRYLGISPTQFRDAS